MHLLRVTGDTRLAAYVGISFVQQVRGIGACLCQDAPGQTVGLLQQCLEQVLCFHYLLACLHEPMTDSRVSEDLGGALYACTDIACLHQMLHIYECDITEPMDHQELVRSFGQGDAHSTHLRLLFDAIGKQIEMEGGENEAPASLCLALQ